MLVFQQILFALNVLVIVVFCADWLVIDKPNVKPKTKAKLGVLLAILFFGFLALLSLFSVLGAVLSRNAVYLGLMAYVVLPFVIGKLANYRTLRFYTVMQLLALLLSAATLYLA